MICLPQGRHSSSDSRAYFEDGAFVPRFQKCRSLVTGQGSGLQCVSQTEKGVAVAVLIPAYGRTVEAVMKYVSTRGGDSATFQEAISLG